MATQPIGLLQNPDYNRFDSYLATAPTMGQRRCKPSSSKWRSINIIVHDFKGNYLASAINSELLINTQQQQQQQKQRKIVFYAEEADKTPQQFWRYYLKANGLDHMIRVLSYSLYDIEQLVIPRNFEKVKNDIFVAIGDFSIETEIRWICDWKIQPRFPNLIVYDNLVAERKPKKDCFLATFKGLEYEDDLFEQIKRDRPEVCD